MAKKIKLNPSNNKGKQEEEFSFEDVLASLPKEVRERIEREGIKSFDDVIGYMLMHGMNPLKMMEYAEEGKELGKDFNLEDIMLGDEFFEEEDGYDGDDEGDEDNYEEDEDDGYDGDYEDEGDEDDDEDEDGYDGDDNEVFDESNGFDDEDYLIGMTLPKQKFIGKSKREFHIRIKLNDAPVKIWRELVVPSNITLEMLAYVLIDAMGWEHEHLYQFIGKNNVFYVNSRQMKEQSTGFMGFLSHSQHKNSERTTLEMLLQPKGERLKFEYDFGDSWTHDLWVKNARDYAPDEEPVIKLLKAQGACPPEDCGGVWGYADLLELSKKKRKSAEDKERLEWYDIPSKYDPEVCDLEWLQDNVDSLWEEIKKEIK